IPWILESALNIPVLEMKYVVLGYIINLLVLSLSVVGCFCVIAAAQNVQDIILNSVALFFMVELDDNMSQVIAYTIMQFWFAQDQLKSKEQRYFDAHNILCTKKEYCNEAKRQHLFIHQIKCVTCVFEWIFTLTTVANMFIGPLLIFLCK
ncbi:hypothetical protein RFI_26365, partial [Reticulomyxa filosa]